jgi:AbrB family looped-hinge helix DNA binding protein
MRTTIDKAGRLVIPQELRRQAGITGPSEVDVRLDGAAIRVEPVTNNELRERDGFLVIPAIGSPIDDEAIRELIDADRQRG